MLHKLRPRSAYDVMAAIAFFIAVAGGSAYAAATVRSGNIKTNAILSRHIKNGEVKHQDLGANSVGTGNVIDGSLLKQDFKAGQLPQGAKGDQGIQGIQGLKGDAGPGAISIPITHLDMNTTAPFRTIGGIQIGWSCSGGAVALYVAHGFAGGPPIYASGEKAENSTLSALNVSDPTAISAQGSVTANLDVIATSNGTWNRVDLGGFSGGAGGCNIWGLVIPGT
jgi:hypothetical protein